ncbi:MAG: Fe-S protein assembly co-chaperone HscB, partial [Pontibacterium sp.]
NYFKLFALPIQYSVDLKALSERHLSLQKTVHPDRFAHLSDQERRVSEQYASYLNEAYSTLKSPLNRAQYLLGLHDIDVVSETSVTMEPAFLMQQMMLREELEEIPDADEPFEALDELGAQVASLLKTEFAQFDELFGVGEFDKAANCVRRLQFLVKLERELEELEDRLED